MSTQFLQTASIRRPETIVPWHPLVAICSTDGAVTLASMFYSCVNKVWAHTVEGAPIGLGSPSRVPCSSAVFAHACAADRTASRQTLCGSIHCKTLGSISAERTISSRLAVQHILAGAPNKARGCLSSQPDQASGD